MFKAKTKTKSDISQNDGPGDSVGVILECSHRTLTWLQYWLGTNRSGTVLVRLAAGTNYADLDMGWVHPWGALGRVEKFVGWVKIL